VRLLPLAGAGIWLAYFLLPTSAGLVDGIPAGPVDTIGLLLVLWAIAHGVRLHFEKTMLAAIVVAAAMTASLPGEPGLEARYFANAAATAPHERGTEHPNAGFTRIDREIAFGSGTRDFPLAFFNDNSRFNFYQAHEPHRRRLEFSVVWSGFWNAPAGQQTVFLNAPGASAELFVDGQRLAGVSPQSGPAEHTLSLSAGWHRLHIVFLSPYAAPREFSAGIVGDGRRVAFGSTMVRTERLSAAQQALLMVFDVVKKGFDAAALLWLAGIGSLLLVRRVGEIWQQPLSADRAAIALVAAAGAVEALRYAWPWTRLLLLLPGGDDPMTYEGYARDIQFNGILMNFGKPLGAGEPFYYQAFYPYFLAGAHTVFGEGTFGVLFLQRWLVVLTAAAIIRIVADLGGRSVWPAALAAGGLFVWWKLAPISADLLNESLYVPLLAWWVALLVRTSARPSMGGAAAAGIAGGFAAITRSTAILSWPLVWAACAWTWRRRHGWVGIAGAMVIGSLAVFSLVSVRNWLVANTFAPTSTELGITLLGGNEPPPQVTIDLAARRATYDRFGISDNTARVIEYAIVAPEEFARGLGRKALFALGFYEPYAPGWGRSPVYIAVWTSAIAGLVIALRRAHVPPLAAALPALVALTQYVAVVVVYPKGERLILPVHTLLVPYAALALAALWGAATRSVVPTSAAPDPHRPSSSPAP
jgi:hypothetical protein